MNTERKSGAAFSSIRRSMKEPKDSRQCSPQRSVEQRSLQVSARVLRALQLSWQAESFASHQSRRAQLSSAAASGMALSR